VGVYDALGASLCLCGLNRFNLGKEARKVVSSCSLLWLSLCICLSLVLYEFLLV